MLNQPKKCHKFQTLPTGTTDPGIEYFNSINNHCANFSFIITKSCKCLAKTTLGSGCELPHRKLMSIPNTCCKLSIFISQSHFNSTAKAEAKKQALSNLDLVWFGRGQCIYVITLTNPCESFGKSCANFNLIWQKNY